MPRTNVVKPDRLQIRLDHFTKHKLERAAAFSHQSVSEFVLSQAIPAAERVLAEQEKITLCDADWTQFYNALVNPSPPNEALSAAMRDYLAERKR